MAATQTVNCLGHVDAPLTHSVILQVGGNRAGGGTVEGRERRGLRFPQFCHRTPHTRPPESF